MTRYRCPTGARGPDDLVGCGATFEAAPDREGLVDCPICGLWFRAAGDAVRFRPGGPDAEGIARALLVAVGRALDGDARTGALMVALDTELAAVGAAHLADLVTSTIDNRCDDAQADYAYWCAVRVAFEALAAIMEHERATLPPAVVAAVWPSVTVTVGERWHAPRLARPVASAWG